MNRAAPVNARQVLEMAYSLTKAGIMFVPMPVASLDEAAMMRAKAHDRLEAMARAAEEEIQHE